jgi:hypothetical protein
MTIEKRDDFIGRILAVSADDKASFGRMNVQQMICHSADQIRMSFGEIDGLRKQEVDLEKLKAMKLKNETVPTVDGLDQVAGEGTKPTELEKDKEILIGYLKRFVDTDENYKFSFHPYYGEINKVMWDRLVIYHLDHHLKQFGR